MDISPSPDEFSITESTMDKVTLYLKPSLKWEDGEQIRIRNSYNEGRNLADLKRIKQIEEQIEQVKAEAERKLSRLEDALELERRKCNHRDRRGVGVMSGFDYLICPVCYYSA